MEKVIVCEIKCLPKEAFFSRRALTTAACGGGRDADSRHVHANDVKEEEKPFLSSSFLCRR